MKIKSFTFISIVISLSCSAEQKNKSFICGDSYKYWLVTDDDLRNKSQTFYYFDCDGKWFVYNKFVDGTFSKHHGGDVILYEKWNLQTDSTIFIGGHDCVIRKINDSILEYQFKHFDVQKIRVAALSLIPKEYQSIQGN